MSRTTRSQPTEPIDALIERSSLGSSSSRALRSSVSSADREWIVRSAVTGRFQSSRSSGGRKFRDRTGRTT